MDELERAAQEMISFADSIGAIGIGQLDDSAIDFKLAEASAINNAGIEEQICYLLQELAGTPKEIPHAVLQIKGFLPDE